VEYAAIGLALTALPIVAAILLYIVRAEIVKATRPIQPDANGGKSLPDVAANTLLIVERQTDIIRDLREMRQRLDDHIDSHNGRR